MKKTLFISLTLLLLLALLLSGGCTDNEGNTGPQNPENKNPEEIVIQVPSAPPSAPILKMINEQALDSKITLLVYKTTEEATARIIRGEADFSIVPVNVASKLYNKDINISLLNVNTWGILYLLSRNGEIDNWSDLVGKDLYVGAQGASPDIITRFLLQKNSVAENSVNLTYGTSPEIVKLMIAGKADYVVLPEPLVTTGLSAAKDMQISMNYFEEWKKVNGSESSMPQAGIIVNNTFAEKYPKTVQNFQQVYQEALNNVVANPSLTAPLVENEFEIPADLFIKAMERIHLEFKDAQAAKKDVENYLQVLADLSPEMVGGNLPAENFYYNERK